MTCRSDEILFCRLLRVIVTKLIVFRKRNKQDISIIQKDILIIVSGAMEFLSRRDHFLATTLPSSIQQPCCWLRFTPLCWSILIWISFKQVWRDVSIGVRIILKRIFKYLTVWTGLNWLQIALNMAGMNTVMNFRLPYKTGSPLVSRSTGHVNQLHQ